MSGAKAPAVRPAAPYLESMSKAAAEIPRITYPEGAVDVAALENQERLRYETVEARRAIYLGLRGIDHGNPLIIKGGSTDYEELLTRHGTIGLDGHIGGWLLRGEKVALATLWERFPRYRAYLRSRTERFIALKLEEVEMIGDEQGFHAHNCATLREALELLPSDLD